MAAGDRRARPRRDTTQYGTNRRRPLGNALVATDFSPGGTRAVARAARLPLTPGAVLTIVHVMAAAPAGGMVVADADARRRLDDAAAGARDVARRAGLDIDVATRLARGTPFAAILDVARHRRAEVVVVGRHGRRTFRDLLIGSTAERVIRHGDRSVLVVASHPGTPYTRPLVAVDLEKPSRHAFELALRVAPACEAPEVVHAGVAVPAGALARLGFPPGEERRYRSDVRKQARRAIAAFLAAIGDDAPKAHVLLHYGDPREVVLAASRRRRCDLLAVGTHGRSGLAHVFLGSVAEAVVRGAACDVLVARPLGRR